MTTDFTSTISAIQKASTDTFNVKADKNAVASNEAFDSLLKTASKPYVSKDVSAKEIVSKNYAKNTKDFNDKSSAKTENKPAANDTKQTDDRRIDQKVQNKSDKTDNSKDVKSKKTTEKEKASQIGEDVKGKDLKEKDINKTADSSDTEAIENNINNVENAEVQNQISELIDNTANMFANEQLIANVQQQNADSVETAPEAESTVESTDVNIKSNAQTADKNATVNAAANGVNNGVKLEAVSNELVKNIELQPASQTQGQAQGAQPLETIIENLKMEEPAVDTLKTDLPKTTEESTNSDIDVTVETAKNKSDATVIPAKTAKENLASDISRITLNLDDAMKTEADTTPVTPTSNVDADTTKIAEPLIKVTDEVAAQAKAEGKTEKTNTLPANKDFTAQAKDKAVAQMADLQNTDTVVTQSQTKTGSENNNSLTQGNAQEQVAKLSVDSSPVNFNNTSGTEAFLNKLNATMSTQSAKPQQTMLNQTSIMEQVNAKFNEMQQAGQNKVSIVLQPESLGKVSVEIMNSKDGIVAKMTTDSQQVKELFDKSVEALKSNLSSQGINVNNIKVECTQESANNAMNFERDQFNQNNFSDSNKQNNQTNQNQSAQSVYSENYSTDDNMEEADRSVEIKNTNTIIKHNGKVDYKV